MVVIPLVPYTYRNDTATNPGPTILCASEEIALAIGQHLVRTKKCAGFEVFGPKEVMGEDALRLLLNSEKPEEPSPVKVEFIVAPGVDARIREEARSG